MHSLALSNLKHAIYLDLDECVCIITVSHFQRKRKSLNIKEISLPPKSKLSTVLGTPVTMLSFDTLATQFLVATSAVQTCRAWAE